MNKPMMQWILEKVLIGCTGMMHMCAFPWSSNPRRRTGMQVISHITLYGAVHIFEYLSFLMCEVVGDVSLELLNVNRPTSKCDLTCVEEFNTPKATHGVVDAMPVTCDKTQVAPWCSV
jgi:hypothetical protein